MANTRELVKRRKAIRNIRKITRTMELIATARFKKALDRAAQAEAYTRKIAELAADLSASAGDVTHPLLEKRETVKNSLLLVLCSNRGLCGGYNAGILREASGAHPQHPGEQGQRCTWSCPASGPSPTSASRASRRADLHAVRGQARLRGGRGDSPTATSPAYIAGRIDRVEVAYMKFLNAARQTPVVETLLPLDPVAPSRRASGSSRRRARSSTSSCRSPATSWKRSCRCRSRCGCSSASSTRPSASRSPAAWP